MTNPIQYAGQFLKEVQAELKKVTWLTRNEVLDYTILIIVVSIIVGIYLGVLDVVFSWLVRSII